MDRPETFLAAFENAPIAIAIVDAADGQILEVRVRDCGEEFSNQEIAALFRPFYKTKPKGMGMGLAISHTIVEAHSGRLVAERDTPHGALFRVTLPTSTQH